MEPRGSTKEDDLELQTFLQLQICATMPVVHARRDYQLSCIPRVHSLSFLWSQNCFFF